MAGRLFSSPPWLPLHLLHVSTAILGSSLLRNLPRASRPMRRDTADGVIPPHPPSSLAPLVRKRCSFFPSIAFGYRGINYFLSPFLSLSSFSFLLPLEIARRKRIPFSSVRTLRTRELLGLRVSLPFGGPKGLPGDQYYLRVPFSDI